MNCICRHLKYISFLCLKLYTGRDVSVTRKNQEVVSVHKRRQLCHLAHVERGKFGVVMLLHKPLNKLLKSPLILFLRRGVIL